MAEPRPQTLQRASAAAEAFADIIQAAQIQTDALAGRLAAACFLGAAEGHSCLETAPFFASPDCTDTGAALSALFAGNHLVKTAQAPEQAIEACLLVVFKDRLYLRKSWLMESALFGHVRRRGNPLTIPDSTDVARRLAHCCLDKPLALLTGGPGTGKTTAISGALVNFLSMFVARHDRLPKIQLCAPTGKAAVRMNDAWQRQQPALLQALRPELQPALPESATTLHRLLAVHPISRQGRFHHDRPLDADLLVFDEASMIDLPMTLQLFDALPDSCHVLLVGDPDQLPSVEIGSVLRALVSLPEGCLLQKQLHSAHIHLQQNFRQAESPGLTALGRDLITGAPDRVVSRLMDDDYADVRLQGNSPQVLSGVVEAALHHYRALAALPSVEQATAMLEQRAILCAVRDGPSGCVTINARISHALRAQAGDHGHVLMVLENLPLLGLSNGDIGIVWRHPDGLKAHFRCGARLLAVALPSLPKHEPAYALTVHKAQGSEFGHVDLVLPGSDSPLLSMPLFYTAVTRARKSLNIVASPATLAAALQRDCRRMNGLAAMTESAEQEIQ